MGIATAWETTSLVNGNKKAVDVAFENTS